MIFLKKLQPANTNLDPTHVPKKVFFVYSNPKLMENFKW
jgi:hypothetical protein